MSYSTPYALVFAAIASFGVVTLACEPSTVEFPEQQNYCRPGESCADPTSSACGNGKVDPGETCDEGASNGSTPCGCAKDCKLAAAGTACADLDLCNGAEQCDGNGACKASAPLSCDDSLPATTDFCVGPVGCGHLAFTAGTNTDLRGNAGGGTEYNDACPAGHVLVGLNAKVGGSIDQLQAICAPVLIDAAAAVTIGTPVTPLPFRGSNANADASSTCPANQLVVGFGGKAAALVDQIALRCAPVVVAPSGKTYSVTLGTIAAVTPALNPAAGGGVAFADTDCAAGSVATGAHIRAGGSVDAFGLLCGVPAVTQ